jgi:1-phosphofructokinase family hexose kinase
VDYPIVTVTPNPVLDRTLTVPRIVFNEMMRATSSRLDWDGKGLNVSRALHALGVESLAMGFIGGATGQILERGLGDMGIATDFVPVAGETRTNVIITDTERYVKANEAGPTVRAREAAALCDRIRQRVRPGDVWILCGSLPPGIPLDFYAQLIALVQAGGARALLDSSDEALRLGCGAAPYLVKPNTIEAAQMMQEEDLQEINSDADALRAVRSFLERGIEWVALSLGAGGLLLASEGETVRARPPRVRVRNPVGAGDALLAGVAYALARGLGPGEVARWGVAAGTAAAVREGVSVGTRAEVEALYEQVQARGVTTQMGA